MRFKILLSIVLLAVNIPCLTAKSQIVAQPSTDVINKKMAQLMSDSNFPGASFAIVLPNGDVVTSAVGKSSKEKKTALKESDLMMSASIGKTYFSAIALSMLLEKKLSLDDNVSKYLGTEKWYKQIPNHADITIAHLMRHQSGIPRYIFNRKVWEDAIKNPDMKWTPGDQLKYIYDANPVHPAGKGWAYSDTNYILLGLILEKITRKSVYELVNTELLTPHKLSETFPNNRREMPGLVQGYSSAFAVLGMPDKTIANGKFVFNPEMEWCGGGFLCTSRDLAKWAHILYSGNAIEGDYLGLLTGEAADSSRMLGPNSKYGLGVIIRKTDLGPMLGHDGGFPGYTSTMGYFPDHKISAALMYNSDARDSLTKPAHVVMTELVRAVIAAREQDKK